MIQLTSALGLALPLSEESWVVADGSVGGMAQVGDFGDGGTGQRTSYTATTSDFPGTVGGTANLGSALQSIQSNPMRCNKPTPKYKAPTLYIRLEIQDPQGGFLLGGASIWP